MIDREYYRAQTGLRFPTELAVARHYLAHGAGSGLSLHPLFEPDHLFPRRDGTGAAALRYLADAGLHRRSSPHPVFDISVAEWLPWVRSATPGSPVPVPPGMAPVAWGELRKALIRAAADWRSGAPPEVIDWRSALSAPRTRGTTSLVVPISGKLAGVLSRLALLDDAGETPREIVFVGKGTRAQLCCLTAISTVRRHVLVVPAAGRSLAELWNRGGVAARGDRLVFIAPWSTMAADSVARLVDVLDSSAATIAQPLNEYPDMTVRSAGAYFPPDEIVPSRLLDSHPTVDAAGPRPAVDIPAALSAVVAVDSRTFLALHGFDPELANDFVETDLSLRAVTAEAGRTVLVPAARATVREPDPKAFPADLSRAAGVLRGRHRWPGGSEALLTAAGFAVSGHVQGTPELVRLRAGTAALPHLRWTIDTPVTAGWWAEAWGDWHFAHSLARALGRLGQHVSVDTRSARGRATRRFDDVLLTLRGVDPVPPAGAPVNLMWVIYNPDDVTATECAGYDQVFAASTTWAAERSAEWDQRISPLLQCTDAEYFRPGRAAGADTGKVVFVGNARRGANRPIIEAALAAGVEVEIYGTGWESVPAAAGRVVARRVPNADVGRIYAAAGVVLNDHWDDMRRAGFVSNRLFDAVASGSRVLSDPIAAGEALFARSVAYCEPAEVALRLGEPWDANWPGEAERRANAERIRAEHSFDQRARVLLDRAIELLSSGASRP